MPRGEGELTGVEQEVEDKEIYHPKDGDVPARIVLNLEAKGKINPPGKSGDTPKGYSFYEIVRDKRNPEKAPHLSYITSQMKDEAVLEAVSAQQMRTWQKQEIIGRPAQYEWVPDKGIWSISDRKQ